MTLRNIQYFPIIYQNILNHIAVHQGRQQIARYTIQTSYTAHLDSLCHSSSGRAPSFNNAQLKVGLICLLKPIANPEHPQYNNITSADVGPPFTLQCYPHDESVHRSAAAVKHAA